MTVINVPREMLASQQVHASVLRLFAMTTMFAPQTLVFLQRGVPTPTTTQPVTMRLPVPRTISAAMAFVQVLSTPVMMEMCARTMFASEMGPARMQPIHFLVMTDNLAPAVIPAMQKHASEIRMYVMTEISAPMIVATEMARAHSITTPFLVMMVTSALQTMCVVEEPVREQHTPVMTTIMFVPPRLVMGTGHVPSPTTRWIAMTTNLAPTWICALVGNA